uniref:Phosphomannomutase n=1 Tax=Antonospora locustae TaxID=278021 RepID=Q6E6I9_ANTLO|nr:phosphomannomutase [Antonospora locustae]
MDERPKTIFLFDVDGTLTRSRQKIEPKMKETLQRLKKVVYTAFVGGSDLQKQEEQIGDDCLDLFDFGFPENGVSFYRGRELVSQESIIEFMGEELHRELVEFTMRYIADLDIPVKRGTFLELRRSMINISPIGRNCSQDERMMFFSLDKERGIRKEMVRELERRFGERGMHFCIGGQISIDCFPKGWDKTYCLRHLRDFNTIVFFGDKTEKGGNDYEILTDERTVSVSVSCPEDTIQKIDEMLKKVVEK